MLSVKQRILAAAPGGAPAVVEAFIREMAALARLRARGHRAAETVPTILTARGTTGVVAGIVTQIGVEEFRNGTGMPFVAQAVIPAVFGGAGQGGPCALTRFAVVDRDSQFRLYGTPTRVLGSQLVDNDYQPSRLCFFAGEGHLVAPGGGLIVEAESTGTAERIEVITIGYWVKRW